VIASLEDSLVRESDVRLLQSKEWLNDQIIGFYFEYLHKYKFDESDKISFVSPEVSQFLKMVDRTEVHAVTEPLRLDEKELVIFAVNNSTNLDAPGGSHWSLLIFSSQSKRFFHMDSSRGMNNSEAQTLAKKLHNSFSRNTEFEMTKVNVLQQSNGYDCGVHLLCNAEHSTRHMFLYGGVADLPQLDKEVVAGFRQKLYNIIRELERK